MAALLSTKEKVLGFWTYAAQECSVGKRTPMEFLRNTAFAIESLKLFNPNDHGLKNDFPSAFSIAQTILKSPEYLGENGSDTQFLNLALAMPLVADELKKAGRELSQMAIKQGQIEPRQLSLLVRYINQKFDRAAGTKVFSAELD